MAQSKWDKLLERARKDVPTSGVKVGVFSKEKHDGSDLSVLELALVHEFGTRNLPERSFIRAGSRALVKTAAYKKLLQAYAKTLFKPDGGKALSALGDYAAAQVKKFVTTGKVKPPLKAATVKAKGHATPLVDTHELLKAITWAIHGK